MSGCSLEDDGLNILANVLYHVVFESTVTEVMLYVGELNTHSLSY